MLELLEMLRAVQSALRDWGLDTGTECAVRNLLPPGLGLSAPAACWQYLGMGGGSAVSCGSCQPWALRGELNPAALALGLSLGTRLHCLVHYSRGCF